MNKSLLIEYIERIINLNMKDNLNYMEVSESLDSIPESKYLEFKDFVSEQKENTKYNYYTPFQKFIGIFADYNKKQIVYTQLEQTKTYRWIEKLYQNLTWYFDELAWCKPTEWQLDHHEWKNFKRGKRGEDEKDWKLLFNEKELIVCDKIGDTKEIYRLATKRKPELREKIETIVNGLIKESKVKALGFNNSNLKLLK